MFCISRVVQLQQMAAPIALKLRHLGILGLAIGFSAGSFLSFSPKAVAIETVKLQYQDRTLTTTVDRIRQYAATGQASEELQTFVGGDTRLAEIISKLLVEDITVTGNLREKIREDLQKSSIGQFVLLQLNKLIVGSDDLSNLQAAIQDSLADDDKLSLLEVAENYAGTDEVTLNLTEVGTVYADVKGFVERVIPALEVAREYLQDYVCDCETAAPAAAPETETETEPTNTPAGETAAPADTPQSRSGSEGTAVAGSTANVANSTANCHRSIATTPAASPVPQSALEHY